MERERITTISQDLTAINSLQRQFNVGIGRSPSEVPLRNYNPVLARWKFEQIQTPGEVILFEGYESWQIKTALKERYRSSESVFRYQFDENNKLRNELFPDEPFEDVLCRGIEYRKMHHSSEQERETNELEGFLKIQEKLGDAASSIGTKLIVFSPPGMVEGTCYKDNFIDIFELCRDASTGKKFIEVSRFISSLDITDYTKKATEFDPHYMDEYQRPIDGWFLSHPIQAPSDSVKKTRNEVFDLYFQKDNSAMEDEKFESLYKHCIPAILYYLDAICKKDFDPQEVALAWNAILISGDRAQKMGLTDQKEYQRAENIGETVVYQMLPWEIRQLGRERVEEKDRGCGPSGGFTIQSVGSFSVFSITTLSNSVALFSFEEKGIAGKKDANECGDCGQSSKDNHYHCPDCNKRYGDETYKKSSERTNKCHCGFKFRCNEQKGFRRKRFLY